MPPAAPCVNAPDTADSYSFIFCSPAGAPGAGPPWPSPFPPPRLTVQPPGAHKEFFFDFLSLPFTLAGPGCAPYTTETGPQPAVLFLPKAGPPPLSPFHQDCPPPTLRPRPQWPAGLPAASPPPLRPTWPFIISSDGVSFPAAPKTGYPPRLAGCKVVSPARDASANSPEPIPRQGPFWFWSRLTGGTPFRKSIPPSLSKQPWPV